MKKVQITQYDHKALYELVFANKKVFGYIKSKDWLISKVNEMFDYSEKQFNYLINTFTKKGTFKN